MNASSNICSHYRSNRFVGVSTEQNRQAIVIGELSHRTGVHIETIRYYERSMMPRLQRSQGRRRLYTHDPSRRLAIFKRTRTLGLTLEEVRALLALASDLGEREEVKQYNA